MIEFLVFLAFLEFAAWYFGYRLDFVRIDDQTTASGPSDGTAAEQTSEPAAMPTPQEAATTIASTGLDPNPLQAATTEQDHTCTRCDMRPTFTSEEDLLRHQLRIHDMCPTCNQYLEPRQDTVQHFIMEHNLCKQCFLIFGTGVNLREHLDWYRHPKQCPSCNHSFTSYAHVLAHLEGGHSAGGANKNLVDEFAYGFVHQRHMAYTIYETLAEAQARNDGHFYRCSSCGELFPKLSELWDHLDIDFEVNRITRDARNDCCKEIGFRQTILRGHLFREFGRR